MSTTVLPQLEEIASQLAAQEEDLTAQLEAVQSKLKGIRAVLPMFDEDAVSPASPEPEISDSDADEKHTEAAKAKPSKPATKAKTTTRRTATKAKSSKAKSSKAKSSKAKSPKKDGRTADWQKYTRPGVKNQSIPDAVKLVLATQPDKGFKIAEVMEALFKDDMPKAQYLKARNRVSNVLSGGVRAGDWHRGEHSTYRMGAA